MLICSVHCISALLRCPASASALGAGLASCRPLRQKLLPEHQAPTLSVPGNCINALLRCPASASALGRASHPADRCAKNCSLNIKLQRFLFRATASVPSCGALHPLRPLVRALRLADRCAKNCFLNIKLQRFLFRATASMPSCGAQRLLRPLGGPRILLTAAPKIAP